ncbi:hypothetical protein EVAR_6373_1 [Eumeta japonica]|uniref:Uncharacterized protein n=1 Tax=Eumeta variegata TaxID=151549 RepID=A0A4C1TCE5_EUMVA|nr:hypothetical protein EVAR_6373_1 [Eumeta japonica]
MKEVSGSVKPARYIIRRQFRTAKFRALYLYPDRGINLATNKSPSQPPVVRGLAAHGLLTHRGRLTEPEVANTCRK